MPIDPVAVRRLDQLIERAEEIRAMRTPDPDWPAGEYHCYPSVELEQWITSSLSLLGRVFSEESEHYRRCNQFTDRERDVDTRFNGCVATLKAAKDDYESGALFHLRALTKAEVLEDALTTAEEMIRHARAEPRYRDLAAILARIGLEVPLRELCEREGLSTGGLERMNQDLRKAGVYNPSVQKEITSLAAIGNHAAHGEWDQYDVAAVERMIVGVRRFVADYMS